MSYCVYLRKSRADVEAEQHGEGETLARHEKALLALAHSQHLVIGQIYKEVVSGETLAARPVMQQLLADVEGGLWEGVVVMEIERLARGNTLDQGIVANAFKYSDTKIVTPTKTYHPDNEFDEEYFEFGLFMSRREYKTINRRMQQGRKASVSEGKFCGSIPPFGYERQKLQGEKGYTLSIIPQEAETVKMMYEMFVHGDRAEDGTYCQVGRNTIAKRLNDMGIKNRKGGAWATSSVTRMLQNPVYIGKLHWDYRKTIKKTVSGKITNYRPVNDSPLLYDGLHSAIIDEELWQQAQDKIKHMRPSVSPFDGGVKNPLAGLIKCSVCGNSMQRRPYNKKDLPATLICVTHGCTNISSHLYIVEERLLSTLERWVNESRLALDCPDENLSAKKQAVTSTMDALQKEVDRLQSQLDSAYDMLEQGVYTSAIFTKRNQILSQKIADAETQLSKLERQKKLMKEQETKHTVIIPKIEYLLNVYYALPASEQNKLLREIVDHVDYKKTVKARWHNPPDQFELTVYPKISREF